MCKICVHTLNPITDLQLLVRGKRVEVLEALCLLGCEEHRVHETQLDVGAVIVRKYCASLDVISWLGDQPPLDLLQATTKFLAVSKGREISDAVVCHHQHAF